MFCHAALDMRNKYYVLTYLLTYLFVKERASYYELDEASDRGVRRGRTHSDAQSAHPHH